MKKLFLSLSLLILGTTGVFAQKYMSRTGKVYFNATAPKSPEKIEAVNNEVATILDGSSGDIIFQVPIKSFKFERALMQEHFNENYLESNKYSKSEFKGTITNMKDIDLSKDGTYNAKVAGKLTIHGVTNDVSVPGTIAVSGGTVKLKARFSVKLQDYKITIPGVVADKIGKEATIDLEGALTRK